MLAKKGDDITAKETLTHYALVRQKDCEVSCIETA